MALLHTVRTMPGAVARDLRTLTLHGPGAREPFKAVLSVVLAVTVADLPQLDDLSWAAFSGFMVMRAGVAQAVTRGAHRVLGTVAGAAVGVLLAPVIADSPALLIGALFAVSWLGVFGALESRYSYAWVFFGITAGLVMTESLADPEDVLHFAATRAAEVSIGTGACLMVAALFSASLPAGSGKPSVDPASSQAAWTEQWLEARWPLLLHATRSAAAVALLPLVWRWFEIQDIAQTAVTSFVVMVVPAAAVQERRHHEIFTRMAHRTAGCVLGCAAALGSISLLGNALVPSLLVLSAGVWLGYHVQNGSHGVNYVGTQFALGLLITLVQGPGPVSSILPGLDRLVGILIGIGALCLVTVAWPLREDG